MRWDVGALLTVFGLQAYYFLYCWRLARRDDREALTKLAEFFQRDIISRTRRGHLPDWLRYSDEADRVSERRVETLRMYATAALATGIGGTMVALAVNLFLVGIPSDETPVSTVRDLMSGMGYAIVASSVGVLNHLYILLRLIPATEQRAEESLQAFRDQLQAVSEEQAPQGTIADTIRNELALALSEAVKVIPTTFDQLDKRLVSLGDVISGQSESTVQAAKDLKETTTLLSQATDSITPAAKNLEEAANRLALIPGEFAQVLDQTREAWAQQVRDDQQAFVAGIKDILIEQRRLLLDTKDVFQQWEEQRRAAILQQEQDAREAIQAMQTSTSDVIAAVRGLPATFAEHIGQIGKTLGDEFGREARFHITDLTTTLRAEHEELQKFIAKENRNLENIFLTSTSEVVTQTLENIYTRVERTLLTSLEEVGRSLQQALVELPNNASSFAAALTTADQKLSSALDMISQSAEHLERVAQVSVDFQSSLASAVGDATNRHLDSFDPLRQQMADFVIGLDQAHAQLNRVVSSQVEFVRELVVRLAEEERM